MALEDQADFKQFFSDFFDNLSYASRWDGWRISEQEADGLAGPLSRILQRHGWAQKAREVTDPLALVLAASAITVPRYFAWRFDVDQQKGRVSRGFTPFTQPPPQRRAPSPVQTYAPEPDGEHEEPARVVNASEYETPTPNGGLKEYVSDEALAELKGQLREDVSE